MNKKYKLLILLFLIFFFSIYQFNVTNCNFNNRLTCIFETLMNPFNYNDIKKGNLSSLNNDPYKMEIFNVTLSREGLVEIGEDIQVSGMYTLNFSPFRYVTLENWIDIGDYPENYHTLPYPVENFSYSRNVTIDPSRFEVNETIFIYGTIILKILDLETGFNYMKQNRSEQGIKITKSKLNYTITYQCPEIILSSKETNVTFNFFNRYNDIFKFGNSGIHFLFFDPLDNIVQDENLSTTINGDVNILLKTNSCESGGNYTLKIITNETGLYESTNFTVIFSVYNESAIFNAFISKNAEYVSVLYDLKSLELSAYIKFDSIIFWNSTFSSGEFIKKDNFTYISNLTVPSSKNNYTIDVWAIPNKTNSILNRKINLTVLSRPININFITNKVIFSNNIRILATISDNLTDHPILNDQNFNFFIFSNSTWQLIGYSKSINGEANLEWSLSNIIYDEKLSFKIEIFNSSIYNSTIFNKEIFLTELKVLTIPQVKILNFFPIVIQLHIKNVTNIINENLQIYINGLNVLNFQIKPNGVNILIFLAPSYETVLNFLIIYNGDNANLNSYFYFQLNVKSDIEKLIFGNCEFFISIIISSIFMIIYLKRRKLNRLSELKFQCY